jgi:hypothetical protein
MATTTETAVREAKQFIGGAWTDAADGATWSRSCRREARRT